MNIARNLYKKFVDRSLDLGDQLAAVRSILANERTFLAYQRTALALVVAGFSFIKFFDFFWIKIVGWIFIPASIISFTIGVLRYIRMRDLILGLEIESKIKTGEDPLIGLESDDRK
jgi:putative membrane protein